MASKLCQVFSVMRQIPELIGPARPTPRVIKKLSDIDDQKFLRFHVPLIFLYKNTPSPAMKGKDPVKVIREAIRRALVFYNPLAGRLKEGNNGKLMVDCNNEGVLFTEADANLKLKHFGNEIRPPFPYLDELLYNVPGSEEIVGAPLLLIQVTRLACGGFILGLRFNHTMCDGSGILQFLKAVEEMSRGADAPSLLPVWERQLLNARASPRITCTHHEYEEVDETKNPLLAVDPNDVAHKSFYFGPKEIATLRSLLPPQLTYCSTFELLTACVWKCRTTAFDLHPDEIVRLSCAVNVRGERYGMHIPRGYYGNAIAIPAVYSKAEVLCKNPLGYAVELVKNAKDKVNQEYVRSVADLMVLKGRPKISINGNFIVSKTTRLGLEQVDLGWGKPVYSGVAGAIGNISFHLKHHTRVEEEGILIPMLLPASTVEKFEEELKKMTQGSVSNLYPY